MKHLRKSYWWTRLYTARGITLFGFFLGDIGNFTERQALKLGDAIRPKGDIS